MEESGEPVSFPAVARRAGVSVSLLYADAGLAPGSRPPGIASARPGQPGLAAPSPLARHRTEPARRTSQRQGACPPFAEEVTVLRQRLSHHLGAGADIARGEA